MLNTAEDGVRASYCWKKGCGLTKERTGFIMIMTFSKVDVTKFANQVNKQEAANR
ncbi:MAG TPA: hypothetical protein VFC41_00710 [Anaerovoracaceae bacterium]|nr:hypothetical protein [Anaerovoracaceae bacterium]